MTHISIEALFKRVKGIDRAQALALAAVLADAGVCQMSRHIFHAGCEHRGAIYSGQMGDGIGGVTGLGEDPVCPHCDATIDSKDLRFEVLVSALDEVTIAVKKMHAFTRVQRKGATPRFYAGRPVGGGGQIRPGDQIEVILNDCLVQGEFVTRGNPWFAAICLNFEVNEIALENMRRGESSRCTVSPRDIELGDCVMIRKVKS